jgi:hypothetical protein
MRIGKYNIWKKLDVKLFQNQRNTKTVIGGGENYGERPLFVGHGTGFRRYSCGNCKLILVDNVGENIGLVNIVLKCPGCQSYNELPA